MISSAAGKKTTDSVPLSRRILSSKALYLVVLGFGLAAHHLWALPIFSQEDRFLAVALLGVSLFTIYRFMIAKERTAPIVPLVSVQLYIMYGLSEFTQDSMHLVSGHYVPTPDATTKALALVLAGECAFLF